MAIPIRELPMGKPQVAVDDTHEAATRPVPSAPVAQPPLSQESAVQRHLSMKAGKPVEVVAVARGPVAPKLLAKASPTAPSLAVSKVQAKPAAPSLQKVQAPPASMAHAPGSVATQVTQAAAPTPPAPVAASAEALKPADEIVPPNPYESAE
jgi:hypothetical protein